MKKITLVLIVLCLLASGFSIPVASAGEGNSQLVDQSVSPRDGYKYLFKRGCEETWLFFLSVSKSAKADYYQKLLERRLSELYTISENEDLAHIEKASQRYFTTAGKLTEFVVKKKLTNKFGPINDLFKAHLIVLEQAKLNFDSSTAQWRFLEDDINYLKTYSSQLSQ